MDTDESGSTTPADLARFVRQKAIVLKTRKRDGTWVATPVSIAIKDDRAYIRTYDKSGKSKRLRNFPEVQFAPSTFRGRTTGPGLDARARLLDGEDARSASKLIAHKYPILHGVIVPVSHRLMRTKTLHYELSGFQESRPQSDQMHP